MKAFTREDLGRLYRSPKDSHKGQNGRMLVIGGSKLFHAAIFWSADVASRVVDLVHFSSPARENGEAVRQRAKQVFWDGIVVDWERVREYVKEDDCVLIGPGMPRDDGLEEGEMRTVEVVDGLLSEFGDKRFVVDGGALQEVDPELLTRSMIITPHQGEFVRLLSKLPSGQLRVEEFKHCVEAINGGDEAKMEELLTIVRNVSERLKGVTILLKGKRDLVYRARKNIGDESDECYVIEGGNEGLTKGGTGDVLAGLTGAFYCKSEAASSAAAASLVLKTAADRLYEKVGPYYNTSELAGEVGPTLHDLVRM